MDAYFGVFLFPWWGYVLITLGFTHVTIVAVTIFLHRREAHRALELHPFTSHFFRFWLWLTTGMITKEWVAIHRKHHAKCETAEDPHSPKIYGITKLLFGGVLLYVKEARRKETIERYGKGTPDDWLERHVYARHPKMGISLALALDLALFGPVGLLIWAVQMLWIPFWASGVINGVGHFVGYRNADTPDASHNIVPWGIVIGGEELHNNHHAHETSAKLSSKWYEFDIGWCYIRLLECVGLAKVKRLAPRMERSRELIDRETIDFLRIDRGRVRNVYRKVLLKVVARELRDAIGDERDKLLAVREMLLDARWDKNPLPECRERLRTLDGTKSVLPELAHFIDLLKDIQASHHEVRTSSLREASLIIELDQWVASVRRLSVPQALAFTRMLQKSAIPRVRN